MKNKRKMAIFLATVFALAACGTNNTSSKNDGKSSVQPSSKQNTSEITVSSEEATSQTSSKQEATSSKSDSQASSSQEQSSSKQESSDSQASSSQEQSSSKQESSDSQASSSQEQSSSKQESSSSQASSSQEQSSSQPEVDPKYEPYLLKHAEGEKANYIFEAEFTDTRGKSGTGYSGGTATYRDFAATDDDGRGFVTYLYKEGISLNFFVVSDRDVSNAKFSVMLGAEFLRVHLTPENYTFRVDPDLEAVAEANDDPGLLKDVTEDGSLGNWDSFFLEWYDVSETGGYYIDPWACEEIDIGEDGCERGYWSLHTITLNLSLKKGFNCISMITDNGEIEGDSPHGTIAATAPVIDYISIETTAQLGVFNAQDLGQGDIKNAVHFAK